MMGVRGLENLLYCCGMYQPAKVYHLPSKKLWKRLYFIDECAFCGATVASLQECDIEGNLKILKRYTGKKAIEFRDSVLKKVINFSKPKTGSLANELTLYNNQGNIINFNGRKITTNDKICKRLNGKDNFRASLRGSFL